MSAVYTDFQTQPLRLSENQIFEFPCLKYSVIRIILG